MVSIHERKFYERTYTKSGELRKLACRRSTLHYVRGKFFSTVGHWGWLAELREPSAGHWLCCGLFLFARCFDYVADFFSDAVVRGVIRCHRNFLWGFQQFTYAAQIFRSVWFVRTKWCAVFSDLAGVWLCSDLVVFGLFDT